MSDSLDPTEPHPAAFSARDYIASLSDKQIMIYREAFASTAISGNRLAEICSGTIERLGTGQPVSDRYLLGLAWTIKEMEEKNKQPTSL